MVIISSAAAVASVADRAALAPAVTAASNARATTSKAMTSCPALSRLRTMGKPMLPRPIKPILAMSARPQAAVHVGDHPATRLLLKRQLAAQERCEIAIHHGVAHVIQALRAPPGTTILVDQQRPHSLAKIMPSHEAMNKAILEPHGGIEVERGSCAQLPKGHGEADCRLARELLRLGGAPA